MKSLITVIAAAVLITACFGDKPAPDRPELRLEKMYVEYIHKQEEIKLDPAKSDERSIRADSKIAAARYCLSALRKEFGLPTPTPTP